MDTLDAWFPYPAFRPRQREMLEAAFAAGRDGGITMIDAPTGSGKSSVIAALLAARGERKVLVAVRTISQLQTFIRELSLVRKRQPSLKAAYLIGKRAMCPLPGEGDIYRRCEGVKAFSTTLMRQRAEKGSLVPSKDPFIRQQIRRMDPARPLICPYFIGSRVFAGTEGGLKMLPSTALKTRAERVARQDTWPGQLPEIADGVCPYEMMLLAAQKADVVILNYQHIFDEEIRESLYAALGVTAEDTILLIDEAHNIGEAVQAARSVALDQPSLEQAGAELAGLRRSMRGSEALQQVLPRIARFMDGLQNSAEQEDWFDPAIFDRMVVRGSLYPDMNGIVDDLVRITEHIREKNLQAGEFRETALERLTRFLAGITGPATAPSNLTVFRREDGGIVLEVRSIDPSLSLQELASGHHACVLISGTLSPVEGYRRLYFGDLPVRTLSLPNDFPRENRIILCAGDITTAFSMRQDRENTARIASYITAFSKLKGNLAVYFPSYQVLETFAGLLQTSLRSRNLFVEPRDAREAASALRTFLSLPEEGKSGILFAVCGGKWSEGLDYRGEMLRGAMVVGLPLAPYNQVRRMVIDYYRRRFGDDGEFLCYTLPAINRAQQALGRVLRCPEDRGVLVFGERRFLEGRVSQGLPAWMREELQKTSARDFGKVIAGWW